MDKIRQTIAINKNFVDYVSTCTKYMFVHLDRQEYRTATLPTKSVINASLVSSELGKQLQYVTSLTFLLNCATDLQHSSASRPLIRSQRSNHSPVREVTSSLPPRFRIVGFYETYTGSESQLMLKNCNTATCALVQIF